MKNPTRLSLLLSALVLAHAAGAATPVEQANALFAPYAKADAPGCAVSVWRDGKPLLEQGYGAASLEHGVAIDAHSTVFDIGSTSKQFTAAAILLLVQDGKLKLDDDIRRYLPQLPDYGTPITVDHLLHHTSGLRDYMLLMNLRGVALGDVSSNAEALADVARQQGLNFQPGTAYAYSNTGYMLLAQIVEKVSGGSMAAFAKARIFEPLGMNDTRILDDHDTVVPHRASAYRPNGPASFALLMSNWEHTGDGAVQSTVADLAKWDANFYQPKVGGARMIEQMQTAGKLNDGTPLNYGRGLMLDKYRGLDVASHSGSFAGYKAELLRLPKLKLGVAVLCNRPDLDPSSLARKVADIYAAGEFPVAAAAAAEPQAVALADPARYAGVYWNAREGMLRRVEALDGKLWYTGPGMKQELLPVGEGRFVRDPKRTAKPALITERTLVVERPGEPAARFERVTAGSMTPEQLAAVAGTYDSAELNATYTLTLKDGKLWMMVPRFGEQPLDNVFADAFGSSGSGIVIRLERDKAGKITGMVAYVGRANGMKLVRRG
ncbi:MULTISPECIES: serine hydrolase [unclassified Duganella]|uniref:serine hydrolase domain-containing protein n=1 Tax=unclassified Duganella TaxID=2636909 RepID=UPI000E342005|nr:MULTISPECIES: serine hydrolase domain-containing protein [unclassified Duganella]RFP09976.1 class A beta-lactamase-related serine hydrolase [Duganella sp. BJB475]RFP25719.1 class A beta-lactamase-related serine hydrolase [Duganella sp. BJB476]